MFTIENRKLLSWQETHLHAAAEVNCYVTYLLNKKIWDCQKGNSLIIRKGQQDLSINRNYSFFWLLLFIWDNFLKKNNFFAVSKICYKNRGLPFFPAILQDHFWVF